MDIPQTYMAFDFGTSFIGIAIGQSITKTARPLTTVRSIDHEPNWDEIKKLIQTWHPDKLIVGIPLNMDGTPQKITKIAQKFVTTLREKTKIPVETVDERLTTIEARAQIFEEQGFKGLKKETVDAMSAKLILESWMSENL